MKKLLTILILFSNSVFATNYYVSNSGNDANTGTSASFSWATISKVNSSTFNPGDNIFFIRGGVWRETLVVPSSGTLGHPITFSTYGFGTDPKPQILGSKRATGWTNYSGNVWVSSTTLADPSYGAPKNGSTYGTGYNWPGGSWFISTGGVVSWGHQEKDSINQLATEYDWTWSANHVYIYSPTDPTTRYTAMEVSQIQNAIVWNNKNYLVVDGLEMHYQQNTGTTANYPPINATDLTISNCKIGFIGIKGGAACGIQARFSNLNILNNEIYDCGRRSISLNDGDATGYPILTQNVLIDRNILHDGYHTTGVDIQTTVNGSVTRNVTVSNNIIYDSPTASTASPEGFASNLIFISEQSGGTGIISNVTIHNNVLKYPSYRGIQIDGVDSCYIYNNTIYGSNSVITGYGYGMEFDNSKCHATVKNNIFYGSASHLTNTGAIAYYKSSGATSVISDYNIFYQVDPYVYLFSWNGTAYFPSGFATYKSATSQDSHSIVSDPLLNTNMSLTGSSPARGAGVDLGYTTDIGAIPYAVAPIVNAGSNQIIYLPVTYTTLSGSATTASGHTATYLWTKVSGSGTQTIGGNTTLTPNISGMTTAGNYVFKLTVTQDDSQSANDNVTITVNSGTQPPQQSIQLKGRKILVQLN